MTSGINVNFSIARRKSAILVTKVQRTNAIRGYFREENLVPMQFYSTSFLSKVHFMQFNLISSKTRSS